MASELLNLLETRIAKGLRFHEWRDGAVEGRAANSVILSGRTENHGQYLLARAPTMPELWAALRAALAIGVPLVLLPPAGNFEEKILLRQLPARPPAGAALVVFTTSDTGEPRAVFHAESSLFACAQQLLHAFPGDSVTASLLPAWSMSGVIFHCVLPVLRANDVLFTRESFPQWAAHACRLFRELDVGLLSLNPALLDIFYSAGVDHLWKGAVVSLGKAIPRPLLARFALATGRRPVEIYGTAEAAGPVLLEGRSLGANTKISTAYELELSGAQLFLGYGASGVFHPHEGWHPTGDLFTFEDGVHLHQAGDREVIHAKGREVAPRVLEEAIEQMPAIDACLAFSVDVAGEPRAGLLYTRAKDCRLAQEELALAVETRARQFLTADLRPGWWMEVEAIPRLKGGKPNRKLAKNQWSARVRAHSETTSTS